MALTKCMECGKEISTVAKFCPHCGYRKRSNGLATTSMILGIISIVYAFGSGVSVLLNTNEKPSLVPLIVILGALAIIFGCISNKKSVCSKKSISGIVLGILSIAVVILLCLMS